MISCSSRETCSVRVANCSLHIRQMAWSDSGALSVSRVSSLPDENRLRRSNKKLTHPLILDSSGFGYTQTIAVVHRKDDPRPCKRVITVSLAIGRSADVKPNFIWKPGDSHCLQPTALEDCWTLLLHEADAGDEEYHPEIENFLRSLRSHARPEDNCER